MINIKRSTPTVSREIIPHFDRKGKYSQKRTQESTKLKSKVHVHLGTNRSRVWPSVGQNVFRLIMLISGHIFAQNKARQISRSTAVARQIWCLTLSRSIHAAKMTLWPESGWILAMSGCKFLYGSHSRCAFYFLQLPLLPQKLSP